MNSKVRVTGETVKQVRNEMEDSYGMPLEQIAEEDDVISDLLTPKEERFVDRVLEGEDLEEGEIPLMYPAERENEEFAVERLINDIIQDISQRYGNPAEEAINKSDKDSVEDEQLDVSYRDRKQERAFIEMISDYADKKLNLIDQLEQVRQYNEDNEDQKKAVIVSHGAPNGKRRGLEIDRIAEKVPEVGGRNYGDVRVEEVAPNYEDVVEPVVGGSRT